MSLTDLTPLETKFGFAPPRVDRSWDGGAIVMGGVVYRHGLGTHAWCQMKYSVPPDAKAFESVVGLSDSARQCPMASVTFEIRNDDGSILYDSGLVDGTTAPSVAYVELRGNKTITLAVTDAGNGADCDHANWGEPVFILR
jgi:hypothetical protein